MPKLFSSILIVIAGLLAACSTQPATNEKLAPIAALPKPGLPAWIASVSPIGRAQSLAQVRIIFAEPVTRVEALSGDGPREILDHVHLDPALPGRFVVLTPKMVGFVADRALPLATRVRVTLTRGLRDLHGDTLTGDLAWTFQTSPVKLTGLPVLHPADGSLPTPASLRPTLRITSNTQLDQQSLAAHASLSHSDEKIGLTAVLEPTPSPAPGSNAAPQFDVSQNTYAYDLQPVRDLRMATAYHLTIDAGVEPTIGNVPTNRTLDGGLRTYDVLAVVPTPSPDPNNGRRFALGDPVIGFSNALDAASIAGNVSISPAPAKVKHLAIASEDGNQIAIDPYALDPNSRYTVTLGSGIKDVFGQTLGKAQTIEVTTSNFTAGAWGPSGTTVIPAGSNVAVNFYATNLPGNRYREALTSVPVEAEIFDTQATDWLQPASNWPWRTLTDARTNSQSVTRVPLASALKGGPFGTVAYAIGTGLDTSDSNPTSQGIVQLTNLGVFAQIFPRRGMVLVQHLSDGSPVSAASVSIYPLTDSSARTLDHEVCAHGSTDAAGEYDLTGIDLQRCMAGAPAEGAPTLAVIVTQGADATALKIESWSGIYRYDVQGGWQTGAPLSRGIIATDRQLYQPGETAELTGFAYYVRGNSIVADTNARYTMKLQNPSGTTTSLGTTTTDAYGIFSYPLAFTTHQALGYYTLTAAGESGNQIVGNLRVAEFKPPNFKLAVSLDRPSAISGQTVTATGNAAYLFGAPLEGGKAHINVSRDLATLAPHGWDDFSFGRQWFWPEQPPSFQSDVLQTDATFDRSGATVVAVPVPNALPFPMSYRVDMDATDVSNLSVSDSQSFLALPADGIIGLQSAVVTASGSAMPVKVIVTDATGRVLSGRSVHLELQKMTYTSATQSSEGGESAQDAVKYDTVDRADITSGSSPVVATLHPPDAAPYRVRANFAGAGGDASATDLQVFAFGANAADWGDRDTTTAKITLDKKKYRIGDTATAIVASPFEHADVYVAVVRNDVLTKATLHDVGGTPKFSFVVTPQMLPNAALEAVVVRRGRPLSSLKPGSLDTLSRVGMAPFDVDVADRYLTLGIVPGSATLAPGTQQRLAFTLADKRGVPIRGKIVATVVNDAVLQLTGYRLPDLVSTVFADQPISTRFADNRSNVMLQTQTPVAEKGFGFGGGFLEGAAGTRVRTNFQPLAYYGTAITDANGHASVSFKLPDDLTSWRVMAVAVSNDDAHFATSDATFVSALPLMANALLPQFARPSDTFDLGFSAMNQTGAAGALNIDATLSGALSFASGDPRRLQVRRDMQTGMSAFRFPVVVGTPAPSQVTVTLTATGASDGFTVPFEVRDRATTESVVDSGVTSATASIPIALDRGGSLALTLSNSAIPLFAGPANVLMSDDALPLADDAASRAIVAAGLGDLAVRYPMKLDFVPSSVRDASVRALLAAQRSDGGFAAFNGATQSDPFVSAYALEALSFVGAHGGAPERAAISRARRFASESLANPERFRWCSDLACTTQLRFAMLWALAASGDRRSDFLASILAKSGTLDSATQARLARYLIATPGWERQGEVLAAHLQQTAYLTGRYSVANVASQWGWRDSNVDAQSEMLALMLATHAPADSIDGAVRSLVARQCRCGWPTIDDAAAAVMAISAYAKTERLGQANASASIGGSTIAKVHFGTRASSQTFHATASTLHGATLAIAADGGTVHYTVAYTYDVPSNSAGALAPFRVTREVRAVGVALPLATMDLNALQSPIDLASGRVYDIGVRVIADHPIDRLVIEDPLPAGLEAIDTSFQTSTTAMLAQSDSWQIDSQQIYKDRVVAYASHLSAGIYELHYLVRGVTPGHYRWPGAHAYLQDAPEQFGRSASAMLTLR